MCLGEDQSIGSDTDMFTSISLMASPEVELEEKELPITLYDSHVLLQLRVYHCLMRL